MSNVMYKNDVIKYFRTGEAAAEFLGISSQAVSQWPDIIPERLAARLDHFTAGKQRNGVILKMDYSLYVDRPAA